MLEFTDYGAIIPAMRLNNTDINGNEIKVFAWTFSRKSGCLSNLWPLLGSLEGCDVEDLRLT